MTALQLDLLALTSQEPIDESNEMGGSRPGNPAMPSVVEGSPVGLTGGSGPSNHAPAEAVSPPAADLPATVLDPAAATFVVGDRVAVHAPGYRDGDPGTVTGLQPGYRHCFEVDLDSGEGGVFTLEELERIPHDS
jgi:hypothetical protein